MKVKPFIVIKVKFNIMLIHVNKLSLLYKANFPVYFGNLYDIVFLYNINFVSGFSDDR
jgi:hypothetical protein